MADDDDLEFDEDPGIYEEPIVDEQAAVRRLEEPTPDEEQVRIARATRDMRQRLRKQRRRELQHAADVKEARRKRELAVDAMMDEMFTDHAQRQSQIAAAGGPVSDQEIDELLPYSEVHQTAAPGEEYTVNTDAGEFWLNPDHLLIWEYGEEID